MDEFFAELMTLIEKNISKHGMKEFIRDNRTVVARLCTDKSRFNPLMSELLTKADLVRVPEHSVDKEKKQLRTLVYSEEDFDIKKTKPQVAPPADIEVKGAISNAEPVYKESQLMALYSKGLDKVKEEMTLEEFVLLAKDLGCKFKKEKTIDLAWATFTEFVRKALDF